MSVRRLTPEAVAATMVTDLFTRAQMPDAAKVQKLFDRTMSAFHHACDAEEIEIADMILQVLERILMCSPMGTDNRRHEKLLGLVGASERLCGLRNRLRAA